MCLVCGLDNPWGLQGRFYELENGELLGLFTPRLEHQGYPGRLHGGIASSVLDETIGRAILIPEPGTWGVTVHLSVTYRKFVPLDREMRVVARVTRVTDRTFEGTGEIVLENGAVAVEASGIYLKMPLERIAERDFHSEWVKDPRMSPGVVILP